MVQLANVSRDIERDLERGIAYHPALKPYLGSAGGPGAGGVGDVREQYLAMALRGPPPTGGSSSGSISAAPGVRAAAVLMLCSPTSTTGLRARTGHPAWPGPRGRLGVIAAAVPALVSGRWARRELRQVEEEFAARRRAWRPHRTAPPPLPWPPASRPPPVGR